ncbi:putative mitochondrial carrier [Phaeomoniella chlamydospora]|uniref:Putative mitochondrial carrier n=1 Tax=Phaeomoniella chlamydospora TaxID=158046 RepID=A0A0G2GWT3_PHACM|nr:putative mitochondrial carrier [Phaeomoniella chlamydospora]
MSSTVERSKSDSDNLSEHVTRDQNARPGLSSLTPYKGFLAGVFSGVAKCVTGHPFDTIKVRLQTSKSHQFSGPLDCVYQTLRNEGVRGFYKGVTPPLIGWMFMDSILMGSLTTYRRVLKENIFANPNFRPGVPRERLKNDPLPAYAHGIAGMMAGVTVSFIAAPVEHVKARLQVQYAAKKTDRFYSGPLDCTKKILRSHGLAGLYRGLGATMIFRSFFFFWWSSYDLITRALKRETSLSTPAVNFWSGGLSAQIFWITSYPSDIIKQTIMCDKLGGTHGDGERRLKTWRQAAVAVGRENGFRGYWRGFVPCFLRAFPANAMALLVFESIMRTLPG